MGNDIGCVCSKDTGDVTVPSSDYKFQDPEVIENFPMKQKISQVHFQSKSSLREKNLPKITKIQAYYKKHLCQTKLLSYLQNRIKLFDSNISKYASIIKEDQSSQNEPLSQYINDIIKQTEKNLIPFVPSNSELSKYHYTFERDGYLFNKDNSIYKGCWNYNGKKHGFGTFIDSEGNKYIGFWENDLFENRGRLTDINGSVFEGLWHQGKANGGGILTMKNGYRYEGLWVNDYQEGKGVEKYSDGSHYEGDFQKGLKHGQGKYTWNDGSEYVGSFVQGCVQGIGSFTWPDGRKYVGDWINGQLEGKGEFTWPNGKKYVGEYKRSKKDGHGIYYWSDNVYYEGKWVNNAMHGEGKFINEQTVIEGIFRYGKMIKNKDGRREKKNERDLHKHMAMKQTMQEYQEEEGGSIIQEMHDSYEKDSFS